MTRRLLLFSLPLCFVLACAFPAFQASSIPSATQQPALATKSSAPLPTLAALRPITPDAALAGPAGGIAFEHMVSLSQGVGKRVAGSASELKAAQYIENSFRKAGYDPIWQQFPYTTERENLAVSIKSNNISAVKPGQSTREVILGAHYDSYDGVGADDNGSGVGVMLEVAARIQSLSTPYTVRFIAFGGEEDGKKGSYYYVSKMSPNEIKNTVAMINLDSLTVGDHLYIHGSLGKAGAIRDWTLERARQKAWDLRLQDGENPQYPAGVSGDFTDDAPFGYAGIQTACMEASNWSLGEKDGYTQVDLKYGVQGQIWNTKYDNLEYIEANFPGRMKERLNLAVRIVQDILTEYHE